MIAFGFGITSLLGTSLKEFFFQLHGKRRLSM